MDFDNDSLLVDDREWPFTGDGSMFRPEYYKSIKTKNSQNMQQVHEGMGAAFFFMWVFCVCLECGWCMTLLLRR